MFVLLVETSPRNAAVLFRGEECEFLDSFLRVREETGVTWEWERLLKEALEEADHGDAADPPVLVLVDRVVYGLNEERDIVRLGPGSEGTHADVYCGEEEPYAWFVWAARTGPPVVWAYRDEAHMLSSAPEAGVHGQARRDWYLRAHEAVGYGSRADGEPIYVRGAFRKTLRLVCGRVPLGSLEKRVDEAEGSASVSA